MPQYIACPICQKTGMIADSTGKVSECPCCGTAARRILNLEGFLNQAGWTTKERVNSYYRQMAELDAKAIAKRTVEKLASRFSEAGQPQMSKQFRKHQEKVAFEKMLEHYLTTKYKLLE